MALPLLLFIGIAGSILFFPVNLQNRHTCLCQKMLSRPVNCPRKGHVVRPGQAGNNKQPGISMAESGDADLLGYYVVPFGLFWWTSLGTAAIAAYFLLKKIS